MKVKSSIVNEIDYQGKNIIVKFKSGAVYKYEAPEKAYEQFSKAKSKGNFVKTILEKSFKYKKIK